MATEIEDVAGALARVPFGAVRAAILVRPVLGPLLPMLHAAEALCARVEEWRATRDARELALLKVGGRLQ